MSQLPNAGGYLVVRMIVRQDVVRNADIGAAPDKTGGRQPPTGRHRPGMGMRYLWYYDKPVTRYIRDRDGSLTRTGGRGELSIGCVLLLTSAFVRQHLRTSLQRVYRDAYGCDVPIGWLEHARLKKTWGTYTQLPQWWDPAATRGLFHDLHVYRLETLAETIERQLDQQRQ